MEHVEKLCDCHDSYCSNLLKMSKNESFNQNTKLYFFFTGSFIYSDVPQLCICMN